MKVLQIHNRYRLHGGEDAAVDALVGLLERGGVSVSLFTRDSGDVGSGFGAGLRAAAGGVYSPAAASDMAELLDRLQPDIVHVHNVYPLLSPSVLRACRRASVPVVMTCHNYRLVCPIGTHFKDGAICERCAGGKEYWCVLRNCRGNLAESAAYALRTGVARRLGLFPRNVTTFIALSDFLKARLVRAGLPADRIVVLPNGVRLPGQAADPAAGSHAAYVGRISPEKGVETLIAAARRSPAVPIQLAGDGSSMPGIAADAPPNAHFRGRLTGDRLDGHYRAARFVVLPAASYEGCPMSILEAMSHGVPVIASRIGGIPELVDHGIDGLLFEPGNAGELAARMQQLWGDPELCRRLGRAARSKVARRYGDRAFLERIMSVYSTSIELNASSCRSRRRRRPRAAPVGGRLSGSPGRAGSPSAAR